MEHFVSKLQPGQKETWTLKSEVRSPEVRSAEKAVAELVATLYDESLDAFAPLNWLRRFSVFREDYSALQSQFANMPMGSGRSLDAGIGRTRVLRLPIAPSRQT